MLPKVRDFFKNKNNMLILVLAGILLMVIAIPVDDGKKDNEQDAKNNKGSTALQGRNMESSTENVGSTKLMGDTGELEKRLEAILSKTDKAGAVKVMITLSSSEELVVEKDYPSSRNQTSEEGDGTSKTVHSYEYKESTVYTNRGSDSEPYVKKTMAPKVEGVLIVAEGAGNGTVNKNLSEAAQVLLGVEAHKVKVIKMNVD